MNIICLDIDDCIFPTNNTYIGRLDDNLIILEMNLKRIKILLDKFNALIYITSSWYSILKLENNNIFYKNKIDMNDEYLKEEISAFLLLKKYLDGYVIGLSKGDRKKDIIRLLEEDLKIISIDDIDLSSIKHKNHLHINTTGFLTNEKLYSIHKFFSN